MGCGGWRLTGLLAFSCPVPLSRCRSFARCYTICVNRAARSCLGCCVAFYGLFYPLSCRGVGVFKYMPLNRILWLLTGIFGDGVRCLFSALPVASFSPICPALRPLSAAVSWRWCGHVYAASLGKRRVCVLS